MIVPQASLRRVLLAFGSEPQPLLTGDDWDDRIAVWGDDTQIHFETRGKTTGIHRTVFIVSGFTGFPAVLVSRRMLRSLTRVLSSRTDAEAQIDANATVLTVVVGPHRFVFSGLNAGPSAHIRKPMPIERSFTVDARAWLDACGWVLQSVASSENRYGLTVLQLQPEGEGQARLTGTDGNRLHSACVRVEGTVPPCLLDRDGVEAQIAHFGHRRGPLDVAIGGTRVSVSTPATSVSGRLSAVDFPDWRQVIPKAYELSCTLDATAFRTAMRLCRGILPNSTPCPAVALSPSADAVEVIIKGPIDSGLVVHTQVPILERVGEWRRIGLNPFFVDDALVGMRGLVRWSGNPNTLTANELRSARVSDVDRFAIVMPVRLD